jgi:RNA ligase (TIGR02306 family)
MRKLASIQIIKALDPIPDADRIECAEVLGWKIVVRKGEFTVGQQCVFFEVDSLIPRRPWNDFLADKNKPDAPIRLKTVRLRKQLSQGLAMPLDTFANYSSYCFHPDKVVTEGDDLTEILGISKYEPPIPACLNGDVKGSFPRYVPKTDEMRIQSFPALIDEFQGKDVYISVKVDGTSSTFAYKDGELDVCGRNWSYKEGDNTYWKIARKYGIPEKLQKIHNETGKNYAVQGEIVGPSVQKNHLGLKDQELRVFNVYDINEGRYLDFEEFSRFCDSNLLPRVSVIYVGSFKYSSVDELLKMAEGFYESGYPREGIVIRPVKEFISDVLNSRASFKVLNNVFLEKEGKETA